MISSGISRSAPNRPTVYTPRGCGGNLITDVLSSDSGGQAAALLTSLIATSESLGIDPFAYLRDIFAPISAHP